MMSESKRENVPPPYQSVRIIQGSADEPSIVPARPLSLSDEGLLAVLPTGAARELATVENPKKIYKEMKKIPANSKQESSKDPSEAYEANCSGAEPKNKGKEKEFKAPMDIDKIGAQKRKKIIVSDDDDSDEIFNSSQKSSSSKRRATRDEEEEAESIDGSAECFTAPTSIIMSSDERNVDYNSSAQDDRTEQEERTKEEVVKRKVGKPRKIRRQALGLVELGAKEIKSDKEDEETEKCDNMSVSTAGTLAIKWLEDVDLIRAKSRNIRGDLSGQMKKKLGKSKEVLKSLIKKAEYKGDIALIKKRNVELESKLRLQESYQREKDKEIKILPAMLNEFKGEINMLKGKIKKLEENKVEDGSKSPKYKERKDTYWNSKYLHLLVLSQKRKI